MRDSTLTTYSISKRYFRVMGCIILLIRDSRKFWITTGLFPQELLIDLGGTKPINDVRFTSTGSKSIIPFHQLELSPTCPKPIS